MSVHCFVSVVIATAVYIVCRAVLPNPFLCSYLGSLPLDPTLLASCEAGEAYVTTHPTARGVPAFLAVAAAVAAAVEGPAATVTIPGVQVGQPDDEPMVSVVSVAGHAGHAGSHAHAVAS